MYRLTDSRVELQTFNGWKTFLINKEDRDFWVALLPVLNMMMVPDAYPKGEHDTESAE